MLNKKHTYLLPVRVISVISKYVNHHSSCSTCIISDNIQNESMNGNQQGITPSELMSLWLFSESVVYVKISQDYQGKFWLYLLETYFGPHNNVRLTWGETMSPLCKKANLRFKIDLRFLIGLNENTLCDVGVAEVARNATLSKYFKDKAKTVITSKCYLNSLLKNMPYLLWKKIPSIKVPFIHIMGFEAVIYTLSIKNKKTYTIEKLASMSYPRTLDHIKGGYIQRILKAFTLLENTMIELERFYNESQSSSDGNTIDEMLAESPKKKKLDINKWVTEIVWTKDDNRVVGADRGEVEEEEA